MSSVTDNRTAIPAELRERPQWQTWYYDKKGQKRPGGGGKSNSSETWTTFSEIEDLDKIAFVIDEGDPFTGVDLDGCIVDGEWTEWAVPILDKFRGVAYCEVSPSGNGVKLTTKAAKPEGSRCKVKMGEGKQQIECYDHSRFWTVTGNMVTDFEAIGDGQDAVTWLCESYLAPRNRKQAAKKAVTHSAKPAQTSSAPPPAYLLEEAQRYADTKMEGAKLGDLRDASFRWSGQLHAFVTEDGERLGVPVVYNMLAKWNLKNESQLREEELWEAAENGRENGTPPPDKLVKKPPRQLQNYEVVEDTNEDGEEVKWKEPHTISRIASDCLRIYDGWPKVASGLLFVDNGNGRIDHLTKPSHLFGFLRRKRIVGWFNGEAMATKEEFFSSLPGCCEQYDAVEETPHFPAMAGHYYACPTPSPGDGRALQEFVSFFSPATEHDRQMIYAFIATTFWGGPPGQRPAFLITSESGTGAGKTTLVEQIARLTGGHIGASPSTKEDKLRQDLMTPAERTKRVVLLDNVKESRLSNAAIEALITSREVSGHGMYVGYGQRPNALTWCLTANGASLSRDLAQRCVEIRLASHTNTGDWLARLDSFLTSKREQIIADVSGYFSRPPVSLDGYSRWGKWEHEIVGRLGKPHEVAKEIQARQPESDVDAEEARAIREYIETELSMLGIDPETECAFISSGRACGWVNSALDLSLTKTAVTKKLKTLGSTGSLPEVQPPKRNGSVRGTLWARKGVPTDHPVNVGERVLALQKRQSKQ